MNDDIHGPSGAYAVDAVDDNERAASRNTWPAVPNARPRVRPSGQGLGRGTVARWRCERVDVRGASARYWPVWRTTRN